MCATWCMNVQFTGEVLNRSEKTDTMWYVKFKPQNGAEESVECIKVRRLEMDVQTYIYIYIYVCVCVCVF